MEKYYFQTDGIEPDTNCTEECQIKKPARIGSVICQMCENCIEVGGGSEYFDPDWIRCKIIDEAKGN